MIGSAVVVDALTSCTLLHSMYDMKAAQMNMSNLGTYAL